MTQLVAMTVPEKGSRLSNGDDLDDILVVTTQAGVATPTAPTTPLVPVRFSLSRPIRC